MTVYLLHFERAYKHARHYLGYTHDLDERLACHRAGTGARLMQVVTDASIDWQVARTWDGGRDMERKLKKWHSGVNLCPICRTQEGSILR